MSNTALARPVLWLPLMLVMAPAVVFGQTPKTAARPAVTAAKPAPTRTVAVLLCEAKVPAHADLEAATRRALEPYTGKVDLRAVRQLAIGHA